MSLIYDSFPSLDAAVDFASAAQAGYGRAVWVYTDVAEAQAHDAIPVELVVPIVHVERDDEDEHEDALEQLARVHGGRFVGT